MFQPKKTKHRKWNKGRGRRAGVDLRGSTIAFGSFALQSQGMAWITSAQLEAVRRVILRMLKKKGKFWIRIFPHKPVTGKGGEVGMGGGKGAVSHYVFPVKPGRVLFELDGIDEVLAREAFRQASAKMPIKTKFLKK